MAGLIFNSFFCKNKTLQYLCLYLTPIVGGNFKVEIVSNIEESWVIHSGFSVELVNSNSDTLLLQTNF